MDNILGKGLSELLGGTPYDINDKDVNLQELFLDVIEPGKYQPRSNFEEDELKGLTNSIKEKGVLQPIIVKFCQLLQKYEIIAGERRFRASKRAGLKTIPAIILDISDSEAYEVALIENIQREKLNPIEESNAILKLVEKYNYTQEDIAVKLGKSRTHINNMLRLLKLPNEIKQFLIDDKISMGHARTLINKDNALELANEIIANDLSVREAEGLGKKSKKRKKITDNYNDQKQVYLNEIAKELTRIVGLDIDINHKNKKGKVIINFKTTKDMDYIIDIFEKYVKFDSEQI